MRQMLSVKDAIERVVRGQIAVCLTAVAAGTYTRDHFTTMAETVEKFIASLYISGQIDRDFSVSTSVTALRLTVKFSLGGHYGVVDNMLPAELRGALPKMRRTVDDEIPLPDISFVEFDEYQDTVAQFNQQKNLIKEQTQARELTEDRMRTAMDTFVPVQEIDADVIDAYERAKKFVGR